LDNVYHLLCLLSVPGVGAQRLRNLVGHFGSAEAVLAAGAAELRKVANIDEKMAQSIRNQVEPDFAKEQIRSAEKQKVRIVSYWNPEYPNLLKTIHDPPVLLFVKGTLPESDSIGVAVVGTRTPSMYGRTVAERFAAELSDYGITVVSGLARGVDTAAHRGAVKAGGKTVAVLGSGVDVVYPPENKKLYDDIVENGAVISEFVMGTLPESMHFPRRNRIISGLSRGTLVVEAGDKSGALITAYIALDQGRDVFAVPGNITSPKSKGTNRLIREGAKPVDCIEDILVEIPEKRIPLTQRTAGSAVEPESLSESEKHLHAVLSEDPKHIDQIASEGNTTTSEALALLLSMELKNHVRQLTGMRFVRMPA